MELGVEIISPHDPKIQNWKFGYSRKPKNVECVLKTLRSRCYVKSSRLESFITMLIF